MGLLDGKTVLITGGARGQGRVHALTSAREGANVVIIDIAAQIASVPFPMGTADDLQQTVKEVEALDRQALGIQADVRSQAELDDVVAAAIAQFDAIDILIANHGIWGTGAFWELSDDQWEDMMAVNVNGVWRAAKAVTPHMIERGAGSIVIISSMNGLEPGAGFSHYSTAKHAAIGLMKNIALELAPHGVRCNAIAPGVINTPMMDNPFMRDLFAGHTGGTFEDLQVDGSHYRALKGTGMLESQSVANAALWLNSDLAADITGITVPVDAGHGLLAGFNHDPVA